jgi:predicted PurR-regulated permease PerM
MPLNDPSEPAAPAGGLRPALMPPASSAVWLRAGFFFLLGGILAAVVAYAVYRTGAAVMSVIQPFVAGLVLALLLDPGVDRLQKRGMSRAGAVGVVFLLVIVLLVGVSALLIPLLIDRISDLYQNGPEYVRQASERINEFLKNNPRIGPVTLPASVEDMSARVGTAAQEFVKQGAGRATTFLVNSVSQALNTFVTLLIAFYLVMDLDRLRARLLYLLRPEWRQPIARGFEDVRGIFAGFLSKLLLLCALYGFCTALLFAGLGIVHPQMLHYAPMMGVAGLLLYAVPYVGATSMAAGGFILGWMASGSPVFGVIALVATLVLNGVFDNVVYPRLVGGGVGLHPVIAVFALILGGSVFGLVGMVLAVPMAASIQTLLFRMFPRLTTPTPPDFLLAEGIRPADAAPAAETPDGPVSGAEKDAPRIILPPADAPP